MTCPICLSVDNTPLVAGLRAGALVMIVVSTLLVGAAARFAWRLWQAERRAAGDKRLDPAAEALADLGAQGDVEQFLDRPIGQAVLPGGLALGE